MVLFNKFGTKIILILYCYFVLQVIMCKFNYLQV